MLVFNSNIVSWPILSFADGQEIAKLARLIINPDNLTIPGFYCLTPNRQVKVLLEQDIREINLNYVIINDRSDLSDPSDLIRLQNILNINYNLINKIVETIKHRKIGKVMDFTINIKTMMVDSLEVGQSLYRNFKGSSLKINRSQIIELNDKKIIIDNLEEEVKSAVPINLFS